MIIVAKQYIILWFDFNYGIWIYYYCVNISPTVIFRNDSVYIYI